MAPRRRKGKRAGESLIEFTLVGIPLIFIVISTSEMARGMWNYQTLAYSVRAGARYVSAHGKGCTQNGNSCSATVSSVAHAIAGAAVGLPPQNFTVVLSSATAASVSCAPLNSCYNNNTVWPPSPDNTAGKDIGIYGSYTFSSALTMFWPGAGSVPFGVFTLTAWTRQPIAF